MSKITVAKLNLLEPNEVMDLVGTNLNHFSSMLEKTSYEAEISRIMGKGLSSNFLEDALLQNFVKTCEELVGISPKGIRLLLSSFLLKFEVGCVKSLLRAKKAGLTLEEAMKYILPTGKLDEPRCTRTFENSRNVVDVVESLHDLEYGQSLEEAFAVYEEKKSFYLLEVALDRYVYSKIWWASEKLSGLDKKIAKTIIGLEIDSANIKTILRCKVMGISEKQIKQYLIPVSEVLGEKELDEILLESSVQSIINSFIRFAKRASARDHLYIYTEIQESKVTILTEIERMLDRGLVEACLRMLKRYTSYFNIGLILAFVNLKWFEVRNLRAIVRGTDAGIPPGQVKKMLILPR